YRHARSQRADGPDGRRRGPRRLGRHPGLAESQKIGGRPLSRSTLAWLARVTAGLVTALAWVTPATAQDVMFVQGHYQVPVVKENLETRTFGGNVRYMDIMDIDQQTHMLY